MSQTEGNYIMKHFHHISIYYLRRWHLEDNDDFMEPWRDYYWACRLNDKS